MPDTVSKHYSLLCNLMVSILALFFEPSELQVHHFHLEHFKGDNPSQFFKCKLTKNTFNTKLFFQKNVLDYKTYFNSVRLCEMFLSAYWISTRNIWQPLTWNTRCISTTNIQWIKEALFHKQFANLRTSEFQMHIADILNSLKTQTSNILKEEKCNKELFYRMLKTVFLVSKKLDILHSWSTIKALQIVLFLTLTRPMSDNS